MRVSLESQQKTIAYGAYKDFENIDLINKGCVIFDFAFLDHFNCESLLRLAMFGEVDHSKATTCELLRKVVLLLNVAFV